MINGSRYMIRTMTENDLIAAYQLNQAHVPAVGDESLESFTALFGLRAS